MKNLSLNKKISLVISIFILGLVTVSVLGISGLGSIHDSLSGIVEKNVPRIINSNYVRGTFRNMAITLLNYLVEEDREARVKIEQKMIADHEEFLKLFDKSIDMETEHVRPIYLSTKDLYLKWWAVAAKAREARNLNQPFAALYAEVKDIRVQAEVTLAETVKINNESMAQANLDAMNLYSSSRTIMLLVSALATLFATGLAFAILSATSKKINIVIQSLKEGSLQVSSAAQQIASSSEELSQASTEQAASLEETAASIEEMNSMIAKTSENANAAARTSTQSQEAVNKGKHVVEKMIHSMDAINQNSERMNEIVKVIEDIGAKTKVINDIVFQTKLLSFNASVEAARAGEHGKGFAVVAEEVGNLAQMSGNAAHEISALLESSTQKVQEIIQETKDNVESGAEVARQCGQVFEDVVQNVEKVTGMAAEISSASEEQARGCAEVTKAMAQVDQATQQNSATSEECASASEQLASQAEVLESTVNDLVGTILGANASFKSEAPAPVKPVVKKKSGSVVHLKAAPLKQHAAPLKKAVGAPSYDHPDFEEV